MKLLRKNVMKSPLFQPVVLGFILSFSAHFVQAEDSFDKPKKEVEEVLPPNLTVTFNLNSNLPEEETAYYSQIVEELLRNLPRRVELYGDNQKLLSDYKNLDHMKVLAYLPTSKEDGLSGERELRYFEVEFFPPKKRLKGLPKDMKNTVVAHKGRYEDFLTKLSDIQNDSGTLIDVDAALKQTENGMKSLTISKADLAPKKPTLKAKKQPKSASVKSQIELAYFGDERDVSGSHKKKLEKLLTGLKSQNIKSVRVTSQALGGLKKTATEISAERVKSLQKLFKENGVIVSDEKWSAVIVQAAVFQSLALEVISQK